MHYSEIRSYLLDVKPYVNFSGLCRQFEISKQALSTFLGGYDHAVTYSKLVALVQFIKGL